jgi:hypothetical protein
VEAAVGPENGSPVAAAVGLEAGAKPAKKKRKVQTEHAELGGMSSVTPGPVKVLM